MLHMTLNDFKIKLGLTEDKIITEHIIKIRSRWKMQQDVYLNKSFHYVLFEISVRFVMTIPTARVYRAL